MRAISTSARNRRLEDARLVVDAIYAFANEHGVPNRVSAREIAREYTDSTARMTAMRVGAASAEALATLQRLGWGVRYEEHHSKKWFIIDHRPAWR
jgi:hypothetical protein